MTTFFETHNGRIHVMNGTRALCGARLWPDDKASDEQSFRARPTACRSCKNSLHNTKTGRPKHGAK